jgi:hypothetical protein
MLDKYTIYVHRKNQLLSNYQIQLFTLRPAGPLIMLVAPPFCLFMYVAGRGDPAELIAFI